MAIEPGTRMHSGEELNAIINAPITTVVPVTGATITLAAGARALYVNPVGTIATLTIQLPPNPVAGQRVDISFGQIVTALTIQDASGAAVTGAASAGAVGADTVLRYTGTAWVKWS
jgi:hypothetical protein